MKHIDPSNSRSAAIVTCALIAALIASVVYLDKHQYRSRTAEQYTSSVLRFAHLNSLSPTFLQWLVLYSEATSPLLTQSSFTTTVEGTIADMSHNTHTMSTAVGSTYHVGRPGEIVSNATIILMTASGDTYDVTFSEYELRILHVFDESSRTELELNALEIGDYITITKTVDPTGDATNDYHIVSLDIVKLDTDGGEK